MEFHKDIADRVARHKHVALAAGALVLVSAGGAQALRRHFKTQGNETITDVSYEDAIKMLSSPGHGRRQRPLSEVAVLVAANGGISRQALQDHIHSSEEDLKAVTADLRGWGFMLGGRLRLNNGKSGFAAMSYSYLPTERLMNLLVPEELAAHPELDFLQEAADRLDVDLALVHEVYEAAKQRSTSGNS